MSPLIQIFSHPRNFFSASHFLINFSQCERLHGHNYQVKVLIQYQKINFNFPIDYRILNEAIQNELRLLNQKIILPKQSDRIKIGTSKSGENWDIYVGNKYYSFPQKDVVFLEGIEQTTSENIAFYLHKRLGSWLNSNFPNMVEILEISILENIGNQAKYSAPIE